MFGNDDDDDFIVSAGGSTKLASLFDTAQSDSGNQSLKYSAPKQPKKAKQNEPQNVQTSAEPKSNSSATAVLHAVAASTYKYENNKHVHKGKLGVALLGSHETKSYKLLLYKGQQQHVAMATINANFSFIIQSNNYATFYDDQQENWSLNFESEQAIIEFAKQICVAKANFCGSAMESVITQDLIMGDGESLDEQDSVELKYTGWFLSDSRIGEMFESNSAAEKCLRVKIGSGKCIKGIENALVGMKKYGKRLAIIPPSLGYENKPTDNAKLKNSVVVYELDVKKVKFSSKESRTSTRSSTPSLADVEKERGRPPSLSNDESIRARGASLSEQLSQSPDRKKATIISRIVKMGQPMLPLHGATVANSESDNDEEITATIASPPIITDTITDHSKPVPRPRPQHVSAVPLMTQQAIPNDIGLQQKQHLQQQQQQQMSQPVSIYHPPMPYNMTNQIPCQLPGSQFSVYPQSSYQAPIIPSPMMVGSGDSQVPMLLSENRSQVMEIRLQMNKMTDKLDQVLSKVDHSQNIVGGHSMDTATIAFNLQRILTENEKLKAEVQEKNAKIENQNEKICDLLQKNQRFIEQSSSFLEQRSSNSLQMNSVQVQLYSLEQEKLKLSSELNDTGLKCSSLQSDLLRAQEKVKEFETAAVMAREELQHCQGMRDNLQNEVAALKQSLENMQENLEKEKMLRLQQEEELGKAKVEVDSANEKLTKATEKVLSLESQLETMRLEGGMSKTKSEIAPADSGAMDSTMLVNEVKKIMNTVYKQLQSQFERDVEYSGSEVCRLMKETVLFVTLKLMEKYNSTNEGSGKSSPLKTQAPDSENSSNNTNDDKPDSTKLTPPPSSSDKPINSSENDKSIMNDSASSHSQQATEPWKPELPPAPTFNADDEEEDMTNECDWLE